MSRKIDNSQDFKVAAKLLSTHSEDVTHFLKYGTPPDSLISYVLGTKFSKSLNTASGQKRLYEMLKVIRQFIKELPIRAYLLYQDIKVNFQHRRADTRNNAICIAESILHRVSSEYKPEVLFAFDSINVWIKSVYGKELGYHTIHKVLELLEEQHFFKIVEWGKRGMRSRCTKIKVIFSDVKDLSFNSAVDDWLLSRDHAMMAVYARESATRQDVLEARIHHYAENWLEDQENEKSLWDQGFRLFKYQDAIISSDAENVSVVNDLEEIVNEVHTYRFLGSLVPTLQENDASSRTSPVLLSG